MTNRGQMCPGALCEDLIHSNVKPENILYTRKLGKGRDRPLTETGKDNNKNNNDTCMYYFFCLSEFGLANLVPFGPPTAGPIARNLGGFNTNASLHESYTRTQQTIQHIATTEASVERLRPMAVADRARWASAAQMLCSVFEKGWPRHGSKCLI
ncbi:hypothetical protein SBRCBS47491_008034 [Sporothrix bragantina]|uniref:Protein kinase domain-containing protein n=1 Tax=Sporothrix bragantina TaxID=671064 RepID=A0ABP0CI40_9PEZI